MAGRGSFTESFPLFGYDLADYNDLFEEKLELLAIRDNERITWAASTARRSTTWPCTRARCRIRCRCGWPSAATRRRHSARRGSDSRWHSRSSAASPPSSPRQSGPLQARGRSAVSINSHGYVADTTSRQPTSSSPLRDDDEPNRARARLAAAVATAVRPAVHRPARCWSAAPTTSPGGSSRSADIFRHQRFLAQINVGGLPHEEDAARDQAVPEPKSDRGSKLTQQP